MNEPSSEFATENRHVDRTAWHRILGTLLELLLTRVGIIVQSEVQVMSDPPKVDILLLRREGIAWTAEQLALLCDGLRNTRARHLLIEFKYTESFSIEALLQALGYGYFYRTAQQLAESDVQVFVMVARTPHKRLLQHFGYEASEVAGVYHSQQPLVSMVQLIVLNQLALTPHNAFVQCFASRRSIYRSAFERVLQLGEAQLSDSLWALLAGLQNQRESKGGAMAKQQTSEGMTAEKLIEIGKETRKFVLASLSSEDKKAVVSHMSPEDRLAGLAPEDRLAGLAPDEMAKLLAQIEAYLQQHNAPNQ